MGVWRGIVDKHVAVMIEDLGVQNRFCILSSICDRSKCSGKFHVVHTAGYSTQSCRLGDICMARIVFICSVNKCCESEFLEILITLFQSHCLGKSPHCAYIHGMFDRIAHGCASDVLAVPVADRFSVGILIRFIFDRGGKRHAAFIQAGRIG